MKRLVVVIGLALSAGIATAIAVAGGRGPNDAEEIAADITVLTGHLAIAIPLLSLTNNKD